MKYAIGILKGFGMMACAAVLGWAVGDILGCTFIDPFME